MEYTEKEKERNRKRSEHWQKLWQDPEFRAKMKKKQEGIGWRGKNFV